MSLNFPNTSRVYDLTRQCVSFWGQVSAFEIAFQIDDDALQRISPHEQQDEPALLSVFDVHWAKIERAARYAYSKHCMNHHRLSVSDF